MKIRAKEDFNIPEEQAEKAGVRVNYKKGETYDLPEKVAKSVIDTEFAEEAEEEPEEVSIEAGEPKEEAGEKAKAEEETGEAEALQQRAMLKEGEEVEVGEERMMVSEEKGTMKVTNLENDNEYEILPLAPYCECQDFQIRVKEKGEKERCKHLEAAEKAGLTVGRFKEMGKVEVDPTQFELNQPSLMLETEDQAKNVIRQIIGPDPEKEDIISSFETSRGKVEVLSADVVISLARAIGIRTQVVDRDLQKFELTGERAAKLVKDKWKSIAKNMPTQEVVSTARITAVSGWLDENGNPQTGIGTKNEVMTPSDLRDIVSRGSNFIETTAETKAMKKSILNSLNITEDGLLRKIKREYGWQ